MLLLHHPFYGHFFYVRQTCIRILEFQKGVLFLIATFCIISLFLHVIVRVLIFYEPVWTTFQTAENHLPGRASILIWSTDFFTFHRIYSSLQLWMDKCQGQALYC